MANNTLNAPNYAEMLSNPEFQKKLMEGFAKGRALAQTMEQTPMQPDITAESIQPEPQYIEPATTTYTGFKDATPAEPSIYEKMQGAVNPKDQQKLLYQLMSQSMQQQQEGIRQAQEALKKEQERQGKMSALEKIDLRPFAEAIRSYGATTVAPVAAPEMTETQRQEMLRKLQAQVQGAQEGMTKEQVLALRTMMQDKAGAQAALSQKNYEKRLFDTAKSDYLKPANEYAKTAGQYNFVKSEIATGQPTRINRALSQYARIMGQTGVLTDNDIRMQIPPTALGALDRAWTFVSGNPEAQLPEDIVKDLLSTLDSGHYATKDAYKRKIDTIHSMYMSSPAYATMPGLEGLYKSALKPAEAQAGAGTGAGAGAGAGTGTGEPPLLTPEQRSRLNKLKEKYRKNK